MKVFINSIEVDKKLITVNDGLNFGRFLDRITMAYEIQLADYELIQLIEKEYIAVRDEIKLDDERQQDTSEFTSTNYCALKDLLDHASDFEEVMKTYLANTLFRKAFPEATQNHYVINSMDLIRINNGTITLIGKVFERTKI